MSKSKPKPKAVVKEESAWAVYGPAGIFYWTVQPNQRDTIRHFMDNYGDEHTWPQWKRMGYTVRRVTITPEGE